MYLNQVPIKHRSTKLISYYIKLKGDLLSKYVRFETNRACSLQERGKITEKYILAQLEANPLRYEKCLTCFPSFASSSSSSSQFHQHFKSSFYANIIAPNQYQLKKYVQKATYVTFVQKKLNYIFLKSNFFLILTCTFTDFLSCCQIFQLKRIF